MLPTVRSHLGQLDVIFSYQTKNEGLLCRVRRGINALGITSSDGTQVGASCDAVGGGL